MYYKLILILTTRGDHLGNNKHIHTQIIEESFFSATAAMNSGQEFIRNFVGDSSLTTSFSMIPVS